MSKIVSVIIPTYGANTDPVRAVESVLNQDYPDVQAIVVDDNGEGTEQQLLNAKKFEEFSSEERVLYCVHKVNKGGSAARNTGVKASSGEYLCFLDDDDAFTDASKISRQMKVAIELDQNWAGTYSSCDIYRGSEYVRSIKPSKSGRILKEYMTEKIRIETASPIISRDAYDRVHGFNESFVRHQDWEFFSRVLDQYSIMAVPEATYSRYYKLNIPAKKAETRLEYMNQYADSMRKEITSLKPKALNKVLKKKYIPIVFVLLKGKKIKLAKKVMKDNSFNICDYLSVLSGAIKYMIKRIRYGTHF